MAASFWWPWGPPPGPRAGTWPSVPSRQACSYSPRGRPPVRRMTRAVLYQLAHSLGGGLDPGGGFPWPQVVDDLGLVQADDALGQRVVIGIPDGPDRRRDARGGQLGAVADGQVLAAGVAAGDQPGDFHALPGAVGDRHHQRVQHQAGIVAPPRCATRRSAGRTRRSRTRAGGARPGGHEGEVHHPQPVRRRRREVPVHQVRRPVLRRFGTVVRGFFHPPRRTPRSPSLRISRSTVHRAAAMPSRFSWSHTFQAPYRSPLSL